MSRLEQAPEQSEKGSPAESAVFERFLEDAESFDAETVGSGESAIENLRERGAKEIPPEARALFLRRAQKMEVLFDAVKEGIIAAEAIASDLERGMRTQDFGEWLSRRFTAMLELAETGVLASFKSLVPSWLKGQEEGTIDETSTRERALTFLGQLRLVSRIIDAAREEIQKMQSVTTYEEGLEVVTKLDGYKNSLVNSWDGSSVWIKHVCQEPSRSMKLFYDIFPFIAVFEKEKQENINYSVTKFGGSMKAAIDDLRDNGVFVREVLLASQAEKDIQQIIRARLLSGALKAEDVRGLFPEDLLEAVELEHLVVEVRKALADAEGSVIKEFKGGSSFVGIAQRLAGVVTRSRGRLIDPELVDNLVDLAAKPPGSYARSPEQEAYRNAFTVSLRACRNSLINRLATEQPAKQGE